MLKFGSVCFVLFVCCVVKYEAALTEAQKSKIHTQLVTSGLSCIKDYPQSLENISALRERKVPDNEEAKCFVKCIFQGLGIMADNGKLLEEKAKENARKVFDEDDEILTKLDEMIEKCVKVNDRETGDGEKGCDRAKLAFKCFAKHAHKMGLDVHF